MRSEHRPGSSHSAQPERPLPRAPRNSVSSTSSYTPPDSVPSFPLNLNLDAEPRGTRSSTLGLRDVSDASLRRQIIVPPSSRRRRARIRAPRCGTRLADADERCCGSVCRDRRQARAGNASEVGGRHSQSQYQAYEGVCKCFVHNSFSAVTD